MYPNLAHKKDKDIYILLKKNDYDICLKTFYTEFTLANANLNA